MQFIASFPPLRHNAKVHAEQPTGRLIVIYRDGSRETYQQAAVLTDVEGAICIEYSGGYLNLKEVKSWVVEQT